MEENIRNRISVKDLTTDKAEEDLDKFLMSCVDKEIKACIAPDEIVDDFTLLISEKIGGMIMW